MCVAGVLARLGGRQRRQLPEVDARLAARQSATDAPRHDPYVRVARADHRRSRHRPRHVRLQVPLLRLYPNRHSLVSASFP